MWKRLYLNSWPYAVPAADSTWRDFVQCGGGASRGKTLLHDLKEMMGARLKCPRGHGLQRLRIRSGAFTCQLCGCEQAHSPQKDSENIIAWGCRECNYNHCECCIKGDVMERAQGASNECSEGGWTSL